MKTFLKCSILALAIGLMMLPVAASAEYIGTFCFKFDAYADTWVWRVDRVNDAYQVTGHDPAYPSAMNGGGAVGGGKLLFTVTETQMPPGGRRCIHAIALDLATWKGTSSFSWHDPNGGNQVPYSGLPFSKISCPAAEEEIVGGQPTTDLQ